MKMLQVFIYENNSEQPIRVTLKHFLPQNQKLFKFRNMSRVPLEIL